MIIKRKRLTYRLIPIGTGIWYLSANDGMVHSGQKVYGFCLRKLLLSIGCELT